MKGREGRTDGKEEGEERRTEPRNRNHSESATSAARSVAIEIAGGMRERIAIENGDEFTGRELVGWKEEKDGEGGRERRSKQKETKGQRKNVNYDAICASR